MLNYNESLIVVIAKDYLVPKNCKRIASGEGGAYNFCNALVIFGHQLVFRGNNNRRFMTIQKVFRENQIIICFV